MRYVSKYDKTINEVFFSFSLFSLFDFPVELTVATQKSSVAGTPTTIVSSTTSTDGGTTTSSHRRRQHSTPNGLENYQDLFIETTNSATSEPFGHFIGYPFVAGRPVANVEPLWVRDTEWLPGDHRRRPDWDHEDMRGGAKSSGKTTKRQIWDTGGGGGGTNSDQSMMNDGCVNNVWYQKSLHTEKIHLKWILDSDVNGVHDGGSNSNITIKFRYVFLYTLCFMYDGFDGWIGERPIQILFDGAVRY
jgi:hypothetical protein